MDPNTTNPKLPPLARVLQQFEGIDPSLVHLDEATAAECLEQTPRTLEGWRREGKELPFLKLGRKVRYRLSDVLACRERNTFQSTRESRTRTRTPPRRTGRAGR